MNSKFKIVSVALAIATLAGCSTIGVDGKAHADTGKTAMAGAGIGALVGALVGGEKGALIGAALGGGLGFVAGLENQKKELAEAKLAAVEIETITRSDLQLKPVVAVQNFEDKKTGEKVEGLKSIDVPLPLAQMVDKKTGLLTAKGVSVIEKLQAVSDKTGGGGSMEIVVPATLKAATFASLAKSAPRAKIVVGESNDALARITAKPLDAASNLKVIA